MATLTTSYDAPAAERRTSVLRRMVSGAAVFDAAGGLLCLVAARDIARWLSIPRGGVYVTGAIFLVAAAAGVTSLRRDPISVGWVVGANELFALWCLVMMAIDGPNALGFGLLTVATVSSAGTGAAELLLSRR